jgi:acyl carrier protein
MDIERIVQERALGCQTDLRRDGPLVPDGVLESDASAKEAPMSIENLVKAHIETELVPDRKLDLAPDTSLTGIVDSSGILEIVVWIESSFGVSIELDQIAPEDFASVGSLAALIRRHQGSAAAS